MNLILKRLKKSQKLKRLTLATIDELEPKIRNATFYFYAGRTQAFFSNHQKAELLYKNAIALDGEDWKHYASLSKNLEDQKKWWQIVEPVKKAIALNENSVELYLRLARALEHMSEYEEAAEVYRIVTSIESDNKTYQYRLGFVLEKAGDVVHATQAYARAIALDDSYNAKELGIGIFHEKKGLWTNAAETYKEKASHEPKNSLLHYKLGFAYDRSYNWKEAQESMEYAISVGADEAYMFYRLASTYERTNDYKKAIKNYAFGIEKDIKINNYWSYRLAFSLYKIGNFKESAEAFQRVEANGEYFEKYSLEDEVTYLKTDFLKLSKIELSKEISSLESMIDVDATSSKPFYKLALLQEIAESYEEAEKNYSMALEREESFKPYWRYRLASVQNKMKKFKESCETFLEQRVTREVHGVDETHYHRNYGFRKIVNYTEYYERYELDPNMILYESYHGSSISCNPLAIFKSLLNDGRFSEFKHVWVLNDKEKIPQILNSERNVLFIKRESDLYMRYLAKAKYLINNVTFPDYFIRKDSQIYLNTWHGTPIKFLGKDIKDDFVAHKNVTRNFLQASHLIEPNEFTTDILTKRYDIEGIFNGIIAYTGYPRQDLTLNISAEEKMELRSKLQIEEGDKVVLYAPTWRGLHSNSVFDTQKLLVDVNKMKNVKGTRFLFRGHHMTEKLLRNLNIEDSVVPSEIDTSSLLSVVDVLISDYSSIAFDFMATHRPIIYYAYDMKEYEKERGLYFPLEEISDDVCFTQDELLRSIEKNVQTKEISKKQQKAQKRFCSYDDGGATKRVVDLLFFDKKEESRVLEKPSKESILLYGGPFIPNGITTSFINLLNHIDASKYSITIVLEAHLISHFEDRVEQIKRVNADINVISRVGRTLNSLEEKWNVDKFNAQRRLPSQESLDIYNKTYSREFKRIFGYAKFDYVVNFEGYNVFWQSVLGQKQSQGQVNSIYLHNNMHGEWKLRFPYLEKNFRLYNNYDNLISVSKQTKTLNRDNIADLFNIAKEKFKYCDNVQNPEDSLNRANEDLENRDDERIFKNTKVFINIARLSPEKDQEKLIRAFKKVSIKHPQARLINLGSGPLEHDLKTLIRELKLDDKALLLGQRLNPYPYLKKSNCFILSSNHEGQPMTLFESLILKKPIIATSIVGNRSVLDGRGGLLVENSEEGLSQGMFDFLEDRYVEEEIFDYNEYNQMALDMFYEKVR